VLINDVEVEVFKAVLRFLYTKALEETITLEFAVKLLNTADQFLLQTLQQAVFKKLMAMISADNIGYIEKIADEFDCVELKKACLLFLVEYLGKNEREEIARKKKEQEEEKKLDAERREQEAATMKEDEGKGKEKEVEADALATDGGEAEKVRDYKEGWDLLDGKISPTVIEKMETLLVGDTEGRIVNTQGGGDGIGKKRKRLSEGEDKGEEDKEVAVMITPKKEKTGEEPKGDDEDNEEQEENEKEKETAATTVIPHAEVCASLIRDILEAKIVLPYNYIPVPWSHES